MKIVPLIILFCVFVFPAHASEGRPREISDSSFVGALLQSASPDVVAMLSDLESFPSPSEVQVITGEISEFFFSGKKYAYVLYGSKPKTAHSIFAVPVKRLSSCAVVFAPINRIHAYSVDSLLRKIGNVDIAKRFTLAHEIAHCALSEEDDKFLTSFLGSDIDQHKRSELVSDLFALFFIKSMYPEQDYAAALRWVVANRSWNPPFFWGKYNYASYISDESVSRFGGLIGEIFPVKSRIKGEILESANSAPSTNSFLKSNADVGGASLGVFE